MGTKKEKTHQEIWGSRESLILWRKIYRTVLKSYPMWRRSSIGLKIKGNWSDRQELFLHCGLGRWHTTSNAISRELVKWYTETQRWILPVRPEEKRKWNIFSSCFEIGIFYFTTLSFFSKTQIISKHLGKNGILFLRENFECYFQTTHSTGSIYIYNFV